MKVSKLLAGIPLLGVLIAGLSFAQEPAATQKVIVSRLAGSWYAPDAPTLKSEISSCLAEAQAVAVPDICAMIVPHAGYRYSGRVAACGYKLLQGRSYDRVVVLGPSHRAYLPGIASLPDAAAYETPLGKIEVDQAFIAKLLKSSRFKQVPQANDGEHSVEIQLPLLQTVLPGVRVVPIVIGQLDEAAVSDIAAALAPLVDGRTLVVASSDFTHYGPNYQYVPFSSDVPENISKLDMGAYAFIEKLDGAGFADYCGRTVATICGRDPIRVLLHLLPTGAKATLVKYDTSGRIMGDYQNSVSYLCAAFSAQWPTAPAKPAAPESEKKPQPALSTDDRSTLLRLARATLNYYFEHKETPQLGQLGITVSPGMENIMGAFVTLQEKGKLRGCIGEIQPRRPVYQAVIERAIDAAVHDRRFSPVKAQEVTNLVIEISALTPPHPVDSYRDIVLGRDGIVLTKGMASAVFLPQVAPEQHWTLEDTLNNLSAKAGLPQDGWKDGAGFQIFEAEVFHEGAP
jgi:hypothetical protein